MTETIISEWTDPDVLPAAEAAALLADAPWRRMATIGDSVAEGVRDPVPGYRDMSWADRVEEALGAVTPGFTARNLGRRDLVAAQIAAEQLEPALAFGPDLAVVVAGGNDMLRPHFDAAEVRRELTGMVAAFRAAGADVVTIGLFDITVAGLGPARYRDVMSARTRRLNAMAAADPAIYSADELHLNARGHAVAAANTVRALADYLASE